MEGLSVVKKSQRNAGELRRTVGEMLRNRMDVVSPEECRRVRSGLSERCCGIGLVSCHRRNTGELEVDCRRGIMGPNQYCSARRNVGEVLCRQRDAEEVSCYRLKLSEKLSYGGVRMGVIRAGIESRKKNYMELG